MEPPVVLAFLKNSICHNTFRLVMEDVCQKSTTFGLPELQARDEGFGSSSVSVWLWDTGKSSDPSEPHWHTPKPLSPYPVMSFKWG